MEPGQVPGEGRSLQGPSPGVSPSPAGPGCQPSISKTTAQLWQRGTPRAGSGRPLKTLFPEKSSSREAAGRAAAAQSANKTPVLCPASAGLRGREGAGSPGGRAQQPPAHRRPPCPPRGRPAARRGERGSPASATGTADTCCGVEINRNVLASASDRDPVLTVLVINPFFSPGVFFTQNSND